MWNDLVPAKNNALIPWALCASVREAIFSEFHQANTRAGLTFCENILSRVLLKAFYKMGLNFKNGILIGSKTPSA